MHNDFTTAFNSDVSAAPEGQWVLGYFKEPVWGCHYWVVRKVNMDPFEKGGQFEWYGNHHSSDTGTHMETSPEAWSMLPK